MYNVGGILFEWNGCGTFTFVFAFGLNAVYTIIRRQFEEAKVTTDPIVEVVDLIDEHNISLRSVAGELREIPSFSIDDLPARTKLSAFQC